MTYKVKTATSARKEMRSAAKYISEELLNPTAASRLLDSVSKGIKSLERMPLRYPIVNDDYLAEKGIRIMPVQNYSMFYVVREETHTVSIVRFLYGKRDWRSLLRGDEALM
jgi:toxin ParE1/3/4